MFGEGYCNTDKDGRPVYMIKVKEMNVDEIFKNYTDEELIQYYIQSYERMVNIILPECSQKVNKRIDTCDTIIDLSGVSIMKIFSGKVKKFMKISANIT